MYNDKYVDEYIDIIKKDEKEYYKDYLEMLDKVNHSNAIYKGEPIPVTYQGLFYDEESKKDFQYMSDMLMSITRKITKEYVENEDYRKLFKFSKELEELIVHDPGYDISVPICRYDVFYNGREKFKFVEFNTDGSSAMNEDNTLGEILLETKAMKKLSEKYKLTNVELINNWAEKSYNIYKRYKGENKKPNVAIVDSLEIGTPYEFREFKKAYEKLGLNCEIVDIKDLEYKNEKLVYGAYEIDLVYRRIVTVELMKIIDEVMPFIEAYKNNAFMMLGSFRSQIMHYKPTYKIFRLKETKRLLSEEENNFLEKSIPYTEDFETQKDFEVVSSNKDNYILKPIDDYASHGIYTGRDHTQEEFNKILKKILGTGYIYQEYYDMDPIHFIEFNKNGEMEVNEFGAVLGMFIYDEKFVAPYTRIGKDNLISGARDYYTAPNIFVQNKE
ncbi:glutathionylspermidine synthase family protein [Miniphocaeibacter massiliensis]|uniref:glutathionylspermidine synthase family protein n=1 Tax=Miniphocaeibacter massiliensis TaxID=2041841 RepID=UPI000C1BAE34|nr:glutathionylspermidine synthase family protein [Miniphocaeibacter massiliensis]